MWHSLIKDHTGPVPSEKVSDGGGTKRKAGGYSSHEGKAGYNPLTFRIHEKDRRSAFSLSSLNIKKHEGETPGGDVGTTESYINRGLHAGAGMEGMIEMRSVVRELRKNWDDRTG